MDMPKEKTVTVLRIKNDVMEKIKSILREELHIPFRNFKGITKPPLILSVYYPNGSIVMVASDKEFQDSIFDPKIINQVTGVIPATVITAKGSEVTSVTMGGESLTDIWPW